MGTIPPFLGTGTGTDLDGRFADAWRRDRGRGRRGGGCLAGT
ncbi:hypothetical protein STENM223S_09754 [Streptomyces tendae]